TLRSLAWVPLTVRCRMNWRASSCSCLCVWGGAGLRSLVDSAPAAHWCIRVMAAPALYKMGQWWNFQYAPEDPTGSLAQVHRALKKCDIIKEESRFVPDMSAGAEFWSFYGAMPSWKCASISRNLHRKFVKRIEKRKATALMVKMH